MTPNAAAIWIDTTFAQFDQAITVFIHNLFYPNCEFFTPFFEFISFLAHDGIPLIILGLLLTAFKKTRRYGTAMLLSIAVGALITNCVLKILIARPRPYTHVDSIYYQFWQLVGMNTESDKSFPSGHTTAAFAAMTSVFIVGKKKYSWTAFIFAFLMGVSRIYLVVHYPTDVIGGVVVGIVGGISGTYFASRIPAKWYGREFYPVVFRTPDKSQLGDEEHINDYRSSESVGRCTFGTLGFYWRDLGILYFCEYPYIDNAFLRLSQCAEDEFSQNYHYFRLILVHDDKEFANLIINTEEEATKALEMLKERMPVKAETV